MEKKNKETTLNNLAGMVQRGFQGITNEVRGQFSVINKRLDTLEKGQEEIKLRLDNVAYRFELVELQRRVEVLEKRAAMRR